MTVRTKAPRTRLEAMFIKYGLGATTVARLTNINRMRLNRLLRGIAPARRPIRARLLKVIRHLADDGSISEADLFPIDE